MCLSCRGNHRRWYRAVTKRNLLLEEEPLRLPEERLDNFSLLSINTQNKVKALSTIFGCAARIGALQCSPCSTGHCQKRTHSSRLLVQLSQAPFSFGATYYFLQTLEDIEKLAIEVLRITPLKTKPNQLSSRENNVPLLSLVFINLTYNIWFHWKFLKTGPEQKAKYRRNWLLMHCEIMWW